MRSFFEDSEFMCRCGCRTNNFNKGTKDKLDAARAYAGVPFIINRGVSCAEHNKAVGGVPNSAHVRGYAVDIRATDSASRFKIIYGLLKAGFTRIGIYKSFIHADDDPEKPSNVTWVG